MILYTLYTHTQHYSHQVARANHQSSPLAADKYTGCVLEDIIYLNVILVYKMIKYTPYKHTRRFLCACARVYKYSLHLCNAEIVVGRGDIAASVCESVREISFYYIIILIYARACHLVTAVKRIGICRRCRSVYFILYYYIYYNSMYCHCSAGRRYKRWR